MKMREIKEVDIKKAVKDLCIKANIELREDVLKAINDSYSHEEEGSISKKMLGVLLENAKIAAREKIAICQDTGMVIVFIEMGRNVAVNGNIEEAINKGVEEAYRESNFRNSVVEDPLKRRNTGSNTPAVIHIDIIDGDKLAVSVMPKGFGSENKSRLAMLNPTCTDEDVIDFCVESVKLAGPDACPPYILGIGLGGTMDQCALLAKKALDNMLSIN